MHRRMEELSTDRLLDAKHATESLLDALGLSNYRFDVEPGLGRFEIVVEHEREGAWHEVHLVEESEALVAAPRDLALREATLERWRAALFRRA